MAAAAAQVLPKNRTQTEAARGEAEIIAEKACDYASEQDSSSLAEIADAAGLDDSLVALIEGATEHTSLSGLAGEAASITGTAATGLAVAATDIRNGKPPRSGAQRTRLHFGISFSQGGSKDIGRRYCFQRIGGSKSIAKGIARQICGWGGGK